MAPQRTTLVVLGIVAVSALLAFVTIGAAPAAPLPPSAATLSEHDSAAVRMAPSDVAAFLGKPASIPLPVSEGQAIKAVESVDALAEPPFGAELVLFSLPGSQLVHRQPAWTLTWNQASYPLGGGPGTSYQPITPWLPMSGVVSAVTGKPLVFFASDHSTR